MSTSVRSSQLKITSYSGLQVGEVQLLFKAFPEIRLNISSVPHILENRCISACEDIEVMLDYYSRSTLQTPLHRQLSIDKLKY